MGTDRVVGDGRAGEVGGGTSRFKLGVFNLLGLICRRFAPFWCFDIHVKVVRRVLTAVNVPFFIWGEGSHRGLGDIAAVWGDPEERIMREEKPAFRGGRKTCC